MGSNDTISVFGATVLQERIVKVEICDKAGESKSAILNRDQAHKIANAIIRAADDFGPSDGSKN